MLRFIAFTIYPSILFLEKRVLYFPGMAALLSAALCGGRALRGVGAAAASVNVGTAASAQCHPLALTPCLPSRLQHHHLQGKRRQLFWGHFKITFNPWCIVPSLFFPFVIVFFILIKNCSWFVLISFARSTTATAGEATLALCMMLCKRQ